MCNENRLEGWTRALITCMNRTLQLHEKILLAVLVLVVIGAGYYFYSLSQQRAEQDAQMGQQDHGGGPNGEGPWGTAASPLTRIRGDMAEGACAFPTLSKRC